MNIAVESDIHVSVPKNFAKSLYLKTHFYTSRGECMTKRMIVCIFDFTLLHIRFEVILHSSRLNISVLIATQDKCFGMIYKLLRNVHRSEERRVGKEC